MTSHFVGTFFVFLARISHTFPGRFIPKIAKNLKIACLFSNTTSHTRFKENKLEGLFYVFIKNPYEGRDKNVSLTSTMKRSVVDVNQYIYWSTSTILAVSTGWCPPSWCFLGRRQQPDWAFLLVGVDQTELFYWSTSWSTFDAVDVHFTDVFITPRISS